MNRRDLLKYCAFGVFAPTWSTGNIYGFEGTKKKNILFIALDDLNDWVGCLGGHQDTQTPNLDRLASTGLLFTNAHVPAPLCNSARCSIMSGIYPADSGIYLGETLPHKLPMTSTITEHFMQHGYQVIGAGKIFHLEGNETEKRWHEFNAFTRPDSLKRRNPPLHGISGLSLIDTMDWGVVDMEEQEFPDWAVADWAISELSKRREQPFFMGIGFRYPHLPWYIPQKYHKKFPPKKIALPTVPKRDLKDLPAYAKRLASETPFPMPDGLSDHQRIVRHGQWRNAVSCYLAAIHFADAQVGRVINALESSHHAEDTIIILWSDGGFHLGEKQHWRKFSLWERATRSPLIIVAPGITEAGSRCSRPVSLTDLYPTLVELTGLPLPAHKLGGHSLLPLLANPAAKWPHIALTTYKPNNHTVRSDRWRYIRYEDGSEELYDHATDPNEWKNLAGNPNYGEVKQRLAAYMPGQA